MPTMREGDGDSVVGIVGSITEKGLLDRAFRAVDAGIATRRVGLDRAVAALPRLVTDRLGRARASLDAAASALAVLDPQATLDRGYAIVRRAPDGAIVRVPAEAPTGTPLRIRVSGGELDARVEPGS